MHERNGIYEMASSHNINEYGCPARAAYLFLRIEWESNYLFSPPFTAICR